MTQLCPALTMNSGNKVIWPDGSATYEPWHRWQFKTKDGEVVTAAYTDKEIERMKAEHPEINWLDN